MALRPVLTSGSPSTTVPSASSPGRARPLASSPSVCAPHAFHTPQVAGAQARFAELMRRRPLAPPRLPVVSSTTGRPLSAPQACDPGYWAKHLCAPVCFRAAARTLLGEPRYDFLEVGPGRDLGLFVRHELGSETGAALLPPAASLPAIVATMRYGNGFEVEDDVTPLARALAELWVSGQALRWSTDTL